MPKKTTRPPPPESWPDADARRAIREDLRTTILVEAAAGTGKTRSLVERMVALIVTGTTTVDRLSAVTFTIRAAAQLRQRFQTALESALRQKAVGAARHRLSQALAGIDSCFIGTIHAFGGRLLRERPVEAGVDPGFEEMDEPEDGVARKEAWDRFAESLFLGEDPRLARLIELGIQLRDLWPTFEMLCENSDVRVAAAQRTPEPDFSLARAEIGAFLDRARAGLPAAAPQGGWSVFEEAVSRAQRLRELGDPERAPDLVRILKVLRPSDVERTAPAELRKAFHRLREEIVKPALEAWAEYVYPDLLDLLADARGRYAAWRRREGRLNFQDLLLDARDLLRDNPHVRRALRDRFTPILVDEFQDTDPIQAEILFYLTGSDTKQRDWTKLVPEPGSLFVVGDPKQSIYRFRRADIESYGIVRSRIEENGRILRLSTNFRSTAGLCEWVNGVFARPEFFPPCATSEQAAYVPLTPSQSEASPAPAVLRLETTATGNADRPVIEADSRRIAGFIAAAIARGERSAEDFLVLFRRRRSMAEYARALERLGIASDIAGGGAFKDSEELATLLPLLETLADPDNPVHLVAALRGPVFGLDDEALYRFVQSGGRFSFRASLPPDADPRIQRALILFREADELVESLPPAAAIARFVEKLGWMPLAAARDLGETRAGNLLKALAAARKFSGEGLDFPSVVRELQGLREQKWIEEMSVEPRRTGAVRLMTLHGAKGLEAPVVFLAEPCRDPGRTRDYVVDRTVEPPVGHFRVVRGFAGFGEEEIARPVGWDALCEIEKRFDQAERVRLLYVGATRAKQTLVVSVKRGTSKHAAGGPWAKLDPYVPANLPEVTSPAPAPETPRGDAATELLASRAIRAGRRERCAQATYGVASVTATAHAGQPRPGWERTGRGMEWGRIVHRLLEALMRDSTLDTRAYAENLFRDEERAPDDLEEALELVSAVKASPLWRRALASPQRLVEVPFALLVPTADLFQEKAPGETLLQGAIDLVFREEEGWAVVDYKSDIVSGNAAELVEFYRPQIRHYRRYWEKLTGEKTRAGLYFLRTGEEVWME